jgi:type I restriction enzyme S subunit
MNPAQLLAHFDRISDAPDAIPRLRRFILDLAVRGKLTEQNPADEPAESLLVVQQIRSANTSSTAQSGPLPGGWAAVVLGRLLALTKGKKPLALNREARGLPYLDIAALERGEFREFTEDEGCPRVRPSDLVVVCDGSRSGLVLEGREGVLGSTLATIQFSAFTRDYLRVLFNALYEDLNSSKKGAAIPHLNIPRLLSLNVGLPPLAEQHRIVAKVDELMALCDRLEAARKEREGRRGRLAAASLKRLNQPAEADAPSFREHASFVLRHLPRITTRPESVEQLRQTILNLAVRGKLVPQDPNDQPAGALLKQLEVGGGNAKVRRSVPAHVEPPEFVREENIPASWTIESTARLLHIGAILDVKDGNHGANHPKAAEFTEEGLPFITAAQVSNRGEIDYSGAYKLSGKPLARLRVGFAVPNDVIYTHKGSVGRVAICDRACVLSPQTTYYRPNHEAISAPYLRLCLLSPQFRRQVDEVKEQTTRDFVSIRTQYEFFIYLPPLAEQKRIVAKVEELMALCDRLEDRLFASQTERSRLLESVLYHALVPAAA